MSVLKLHIKKHKRQKVHALAIAFEIGHFLVKGESMDLPVSEKVIVHGLPVDKFGNTVKDAAGNPVALDGPEACTALNPLNLAVAIQANGTSFLLTPAGTPDPAESITITGAFKGAPLTTGAVPVALTSGAPVALLAIFDAPTPQ
jgi:hypothetical protein